MRYVVSPIADENCDSLRLSLILLRTDDLSAARTAASRSGHAYGSGVLDTHTGAVDVGFGFGVPCPDFE